MKLQSWAVTKSLGLDARKSNDFDRKKDFEKLVKMRRRKNVRLGLNSHRDPNKARYLGGVIHKPRGQNFRKFWPPFVVTFTK